MHPESWTYIKNMLQYIGGAFFMSKNKVYSFEFKLAVVNDLRSGRYTSEEIMKKYNFASLHGSISTIKKWERYYLEEGEEGLKVERRGRATKQDNPNKGRPIKMASSVEEDLIAENQRLRMELEYLKKLEALVLAEEQKSDKKR